MRSKVIEDPSRKYKPIARKARIQNLNIEPGRRILVVSDIHANIPYFEGVLKLAQFSDDDILIIDGDISLATVLSDYLCSRGYKTQMAVSAKDALDFLLPNLLSGRLPETDTEVLCSDCLCRDLKLALGDRIDCYSVGEQVQVRRFTISGIYATGFQEADKMYVWSRSSVVRRLNHWSDNQVSGIEITVDNIAHLEEVSDLVWFATANRFDEDGNGLYAQTLQQLNPQIFAWLDLLDMNVIVIIILMLCVSGFNIISGLIILILDSIRLIGTLKALGADNLFVRRIFIFEAAMLIGKGVLIGNVLALALAAVQYTTHLLPLDPVTYYVDFVPVAFPWLWLLLLNIGVVLVSVLVLLVPSVVAAHISPARVMRFE